MKKLIILLLLMISVSFLHAHCQIPCGIYDDDLRFKQLNEHITTIEKSMKAIHSSVTDNSNQLTRWIINKETHADQFIDIVHDYFLTQRLKPLSENATKKERINYQQHLQFIHELTVSAMKAKQTIDLSYVSKMKDKLAMFQSLHNH